MLKEFLISPPFGNWISHPLCTRVRGSYTVDRRPGLVRRVLKTVRPVAGGWVNQIGLRNPGILYTHFNDNDLFSIAAIDSVEWSVFDYLLPPSTMVELNLGCPNCDVSLLVPIGRFVRKFPVVSVKLPPTPAGWKMGCDFLHEGVTHVHMGNSFPIKGGGGFSGPPNREVVLPLVDFLAAYIAKWDLPGKVIAGGGIRTQRDIRDYRNAGAEHFSLSTAWFRPVKTRNMLFRTLEEEEIWDR